ncbi:hypothetical protein ACN20G_29800 (plasmid) [Streptomyces sp. BI20]|uniref:hypothetical protein n=1 Tax=Streptomyces sp. BI20 TaxID=3403460 RepID=UPI003C72A1EE
MKLAKLKTIVKTATATVAVSLGVVAGVGMAVSPASAEAPVKAPIAQHWDDKTVDSVNEHLTAAYDRIGAQVAEACGNGHVACEVALSAVRSMGLTYGEGTVITWEEDGSWGIEKAGK